MMTNNYIFYRNELFTLQLMFTIVLLVVNIDACFKKSTTECEILLFPRAQNITINQVSHSFTNTLVRALSFC